ncbi:hypothetical protein EDD15DRAFT_2373033 [Pisolithus albus]|nr:hypothetical protein EDD15DRAFT_2373033 [Pisolithus albus]
MACDPNPTSCSSRPGSPITWMDAPDPFFISLPAPANTSFDCPHCFTPFATGSAVVQHLSLSWSCGQWLVQALPNVEPMELPIGDDYVDDIEAASDVDMNGNFNDPFDDGDHDDPGVGDEDEIHHELPASDPPLASMRRVRTYHPNQGEYLTGGLNHLQRMDQDEFVHICNTENVYYPFGSKSEWELANWLASGALAQKEIDAYLHLQRTKDFPVSFNTAKDLRTRIESLPEVPRWRFQEIKVGSYQTKDPLILYWQDGLEIVEHPFSNPVFAHCMDMRPYREFEETANGVEHVYGEFMSADRAWCWRLYPFPLQHTHIM